MNPPSTCPPWTDVELMAFAASNATSWTVCCRGVAEVASPRCAGGAESRRMMQLSLRGGLAMAARKP